MKCVNCGENIYKGVPPFQNPEFWYTSGYVAGFCSENEGKPHEPLLSRSYSVGLPAAVVIHDDGRVEIIVDLSEVDEAILDSETWPAMYSSNQVADAEHAQKKVAQTIPNPNAHLGNNTFSITV